jgi:hypothetical protein
MQSVIDWCRGLPTALPAEPESGLGFRRYERVDTWSRLHAGQALLTRQGISLDLLLRPVEFDWRAIVSDDLLTSP